MRGTDAGLEALCRRVHPGLVGVLSYQAPSAAAADELAREALARVWNDWPDVGELGSPEAWAHRVALRLSRSRWRRRRAERRAHRRGVPDEDEAVDGDVDLGLRAVVRALPRRQREALALVAVAGFSTAEVGRILGCSPDTVKALCIEARQHVRAVYDPGAETARVRRWR
jgi:RNA polymerase sigma-70 factor (ECF subfamily)